MHTVRLGSLRCSRLICGSNPFNARSHFSAARDAEYAARFTDEAIERMLHRCLPFNLTGFVYPGYDGGENPRQRADLVRAIPKPFILKGLTRREAARRS